MSQLRTAVAVLRRQGVSALLSRVGERLTALTGKPPSLVQYDDVLAVDWSTPHPAVENPIAVGDGPLTVAWIMSPPGEGSGGHQNLYRFIDYLERSGHRVKIYLYSVRNTSSAADIRTMTDNSPSYPNLSASVEWYTEAGVSADVDAIFATGWETAYPAYRDASPARRFYFVQDFEPYFYAVGSDYVLAENTYRFGFTGVTAGGWLAGKLHREYGMPTSSFDFGAERENYNLTNTERRTEVFFYARPVTERRGFELGAMALDLFARAQPDIRINIAGWDVSRFGLPFAFTNLGSMRVDQLNAVYNRCAAGLVLSMTNMSLLPLELLASGVIPVVNDGPNNTEVSDNPFIEYAPASPRALADRLIAVVDRTDQAAHAARASASVSAADWATSGERFVAGFEREMRG